MHIEVRVSGKIYISSTALVKSGKSRPKLCLFRVAFSKIDIKMTTIKKKKNFEINKHLINPTLGTSSFVVNK